MRTLLIVLVALFANAGIAHATTITYTLNNTGGDSYEAEFTVANDTLGVPIEEFTIFFDLGLFENIASISAPTDWDPLIIQPDPGIPDDGFADWLAFGDPIGVGETLGGFAVSFDFLGAGLPEMLAFSIVDPNTFEELDFGFATLASSEPSEIPLPAALWLFIAGAGLLLQRAKRSKS